MEIIHQGGKLKSYKHRVVCETCGAKIAYTYSDIKFTSAYEKYIICPKCGEVLFVDEQ